jgi:PIN domain nuclease of toxin-antitoxin system
MKVLLDTHVLVWAALEPGRLSERVRDLLLDRRNDVLVSAISAYEIELKRDRDPVLMQLPMDLPSVCKSLDFRWLAVTERHAAAAGRLPKLHGDPFDRLLLAQSLTDGLALISLDGRLPQYGVPILW